MLPQAEVTTFFPQIFWLVIAFGLLYFIISKFIAPTMERILINRQKTIDDDLNDAHLLTTEISSLKSSYESSIIEIYEQAKIIKQNSLRDLDSAYEQQKLILQSELNDLKQASLKQITQDIEIFIDNSENSLINLAEFIIEKMINKKPDPIILKNCYKKL